MFLLVTTIEDRDLVLAHGCKEIPCWHNDSDKPMWQFYLNGQQELDEIKAKGLQGKFGITYSLAF